MKSSRASRCSTRTCFRRSTTLRNLSGIEFHRLTRASWPLRTYDCEYEKPLCLIPVSRFPMAPFTVIMDATRNLRACSNLFPLPFSLYEFSNSDRAYGVNSTRRISSSACSRNCWNTVTICESASLIISIGAGVFAMVTAAEPQKASTQALWGGSIFAMARANRFLAPK